MKRAWKTKVLSALMAITMAVTTVVIPVSAEELVPSTQYTVTVDATEGGTVKLKDDVEMYMPGDTVQMEVEASENHELSEIKTDPELEIDMTNMTFVMPEQDVQVIPVFISLPITISENIKTDEETIENSESDIPEKSENENPDIPVASDSTGTEDDLVIEESTAIEDEISEENNTKETKENEQQGDAKETEGKNIEEDSDKQFPVVVTPNTLAAARSSGLVYEGKVTYNTTTVGAFTLNGNIAFCVEHQNPTPDTGTAFYTEIYENNDIRRALYYGWGGPEQWSGFTSYEQGVVCTSLALSCYYSGEDSMGMMKHGSSAEALGLSDFFYFIESQSIPDNSLSLSQTYVESSLSSDHSMQVTESITFNADERNMITIPLQNGMSLVNETTGETLTGNATVKGGDTFYLTAPLQMNETWSTGTLYGSMGKFNAVIALTDGDGVQDLGYGEVAQDPDKHVELTVKWEACGRVQIQKKDSERGETSPQGGATLQGAQYTVYTDAACMNPAKDINGNQVVLTTGADGRTALSGYLIFGKYYAKETQAPAGYLLSDEILEFDLPGSGADPTTAHLELAEDVIRGGVNIEKWDSDLNRKETQGDASIQGAEIQIISNNSAPVVVEGQTYNYGDVVKTLTTGADGSVNTASDTLPYGNYIVKESKAPSGYLLEGVTERQFSIREDETIVNMDTSDTAIKDNVVRGGVRIEKWDNETDKKQAQGGASLQGAQFQISSLNDRPIVVNNKTYNRNDVVVTITTDANGVAKTAANLLPYGTYQIREVQAPTGYNNSGIIQHNFNIRDNGVIVNMNTSGTTIKNNVIRGGVRIEKWDSDLNRKEAQGTATLQGAKFEIVSLNNNEVMVNGDSYGNGQVVATITTNADGVASTSADLLPYGNYRIREVGAPTGYNNSGTIQRDFNIRENGVIVNMNATNTAIKNNVIRGGVRIEKWDSELNSNESQGAASLGGAVFQISSMNDKPVVVGGQTYGNGDVVAAITTNADGVASTAADLLPYGNYIIREVTPPEGYNNTGIIQRAFAIREDGVIVNMNETGTAIKNDVIRGDLQLVKIKEDVDEEEDQKTPLDGIIFSITSKTTGRSWKITTDENGYASTTQLNISDRGNLIYDTYVIHEENTPEGLKPVNDFEITIKDEGRTLYYILEDKQIISPVTVIKVDSTTGKTIPIANTEFQLLDKDKNVITMTTYYPNKVEHKTFKTDESGSFTFPDKLPYGTYYLRELNAPEGYLLGEDLKFEIKEGHEWADPLEVEYADAPAMGIIEIRKKDAESGDALEGAEFTVKAAEDIITPDGALRASAGEIVDVITSDEDGKAMSKELFLGKYTVKETKQPVGYAINEETYEVELVYKDQNTALVAESLTVENQPTIIIIDKKVTGSEQHLSGVKFAIWNKLMDVEDGENSIDPGMTQKIVVKTARDGQARVEKLAPGTYCIQEVQGVPGYAIDPTVHEVTIGKDGRIDGEDHVIVTVENAETEIVETNAYDVETNTHTGLPQSNTTIKDIVSIENLQPGVTYTLKGVIVNQENGLPIEPPAESIVDVFLDRSITSEVTFEATDSVMDVPVEFTFDSSEMDGVTLTVYEYLYQDDIEISNHTDLQDEKQQVTFPDMKIHTIAIEQYTKSHEAYVNEAGGTTTITDIVEIAGIVPGLNYTLRGIVMDQETGEPLLNLDGEKITVEKEITPEESEITVNMDFVLDTSGLWGKSIVIFEYLYHNDEEIETHEDIEDKDQTVTFVTPEIHTTAIDRDTQSHEAYIDENTVIVDSVAYEGLADGKDLKYVLRGTPMDQETGEPLLDKDGKQIWAEREFTAEELKGSVDVKFTFDTSELAGKSIVFFEYLYLITEDGELLVAEHEDLEDEDQTVTFVTPEIHTTAIDQDTQSHETYIDENTVIVDSVAYEGLADGKDLKYVLRGTPMDQETGESLLDKDGKQIWAEQEFTAEELKGSVDVKFTFDTSELAGKSIVFFEYLYLITEDRELLVAEHEDLEDEDQTVTFVMPEIHTTAIDQSTDSHEAYVDKNTVIVDTVTYEGLADGENLKYILRGTPMDQETGEPLLDKDGKQIWAEREFTAEELKGFVDVKFTFDTSELTGKTIVFFEYLYLITEGGELLVAEHEDIEDEDQMVTFATPEIHTTALGKESGTHEVIAKDNIVIIDTVDYKGVLADGKLKYIMRGTPIDKETQKPLTDKNGNQICVEKEFTPTESSGFVEMEFTIDTSEMNGKSIVFFEYLYLITEDGELLVAGHEDINDVAQTVTVKVGSLTATMPGNSGSGIYSLKTGDIVNFIPYVIALLLAGCIITAVIIKRRKVLSENAKQES